MINKRKAGTLVPALFFGIISTGFLLWGTKFEPGIMAMAAMGSIKFSAYFNIMLVEIPAFFTAHHL